VPPVALNPLLYTHAFPTTITYAAIPGPHPARSSVELFTTA
jgi:hypothetical protein